MSFTVCEPELENSSPMVDCTENRATRVRLAETPRITRGSDTSKGGRRLSVRDTVQWCGCGWALLAGDVDGGHGGGAARGDRS